MNNQQRRHFVLKLVKSLGTLGILGYAPGMMAKGRQSRIKSVSIQNNGEAQRVLFELDQSTPHSYFTLSSPDRVVIDFKHTSNTGQIGLDKAALKQYKLIKSIRHATRNNNDLRVVLDVARATDASTRLINNSNGTFLEVALSPQNMAGKLTAKQEKKLNKFTVSKGKGRNGMLVMIDPGHGGKDPGAIGRKGTYEKTIALEIAKKLKKHIDAQPGMRAMLTRDGDYYISLRKRISRARKSNADLFISIHADANPNSRLTGSSVYVLSENGASSEAARWLAESENSYEMKLAGASLKHENRAVSSMLLDLSLSDTIDKSLHVANDVLGELGKVNKVLRSRVESAGFVVLKSPDIPSILLETAFISNPMEERRLKTSRYQEQICKAIVKGIRKYQTATNEQTDHGTESLA